MNRMFQAMEHIVKNDRWPTQATAEKALEQNGKDLGGRPLKVNIATDKPRTGGGGGFRGGNGGGNNRW
jgi:cold-inducible RNA-binding protein